MKKALLVAASLITTASAVTTGEAVKASPQFVLQQNSAGNLIFQGVGTAQYNNSIGTNNSFQVGSSTNLGVNASTSSTPEYAVQSHAKLDLAGSSTLSQVIGTSGASQNTTAEQIAAITYADTHAKTEANSYADTEADLIATTDASTARSTWENSNGGSWASYNDASTGGDDGMGWTSSSSHQNEDNWNSSSQDAYDTAYNSTFTSERTSLYESKYDSEYTSTYSDAVSAIQSQSSTNESNGVIKGTFTTKEGGSAAASSSMSDWSDSAKTDAENATKSVYKNNFSEYQTANVDPTDSTVYTGDYANEQEYLDARSTAYSTAYNDAYSEALSSVSRESTSDVEVTGIGSDASVTSASTSSFDVLITTTIGSGSSNSAAESTATANGAAGANLSTSSFANQSMASTASAFMQAFGGDEVPVGYVKQSDVQALLDAEDNGSGLSSNIDLNSL